MKKSTSALLVFPHQLFEAILHREKNDTIILIEDDLFFRQYRFHKQKLILHRASMKAFEVRLQSNGFNVLYIESSSKKSSMSQLESELTSSMTIRYYDVVDDWLQQRIDSLVKKLDLKREVMNSPSFLTTKGQITEYFDRHPNRMQGFYEWQRKRLGILVENDKPVGGKWSFDEKNRKKLPKGIDLPKPYTDTSDDEIEQAIEWVDKHFASNPGSTDFHYPLTHTQALERLETFLGDRFEKFGPYEDAIAKDESELFHSVLSAPINIGLITPRQVVDRTLEYAKKHDTPIESVEGFIRQIIGWREYMRATYILHGRSMRTKNTLGHSRKLDKSWWDGTTNLDPVDHAIKRINDTAYAHHIERLMVLGNSMLLLRIDPDEIYEWFMSLFIDAYDWVMVPNVYAMSQFATGDKITTKPYISGSNYIIKMSDYKKGEWSDVWDALYWRFVSDHRELFENNYRSSMMVKLYDNLKPEKKQQITKLSNEWL